MLNQLTTEKRNIHSMHLDEMSVIEAVTLMNQEDLNVLKGIQEQIPEISKVIEITIEQMKKGGRLIYLGAGTSGRLGLLDAAECIPTFGVKEGVVIGLIAGGEKAFTKAVEGAEDSKELGQQDLENIHLTKNDMVIGLAASGRTPYVIGGFEYAQTIGAKTASISCNKNALMSAYADYVVEVDNQPEVLTGSTRLKSGTSQKMILNMISTITMVHLGKVYGNLMVDVLPTNEKLVKRCQLIIQEATGVDEAQALQYYQASHHQPKVAIVMILKDCSYEDAIQALEKADGFVAKALKD